MSQSKLNTYYLQIYFRKQNKTAKESQGKLNLIDVSYASPKNPDIFWETVGSLGVPCFVVDG